MSKLDQAALRKAREDATHAYWAVAQAAAVVEEVDCVLSAATELLHAAGLAFLVEDSALPELPRQDSDQTSVIVDSLINVSRAYADLQAGLLQLAVGQQRALAWVDARSTLRALEKISPDRDSIVIQLRSTYINAALHYSELQDYGRAQAELEELLGQFPDDQQAMLTLQTVQVRSGLTEARARFARDEWREGATALVPVFMLSAANQSDIRTMLKEFLDEYHSNESAMNAIVAAYVVPLLTDARTHFQNGEVAAGRSLLEQLLTWFPEREEAQLELRESYTAPALAEARQHFSSGAWEQGRTVLERLLQRFPDDQKLSNAISESYAEPVLSQARKLAAEGAWKRAWSELEAFLYEHEDLKYWVMQDYVEISNTVAQQHFSKRQWEDGRTVLEAGLQRFDFVNELRDALGQSFIDEAELYFASNQWQEAIDVLKKLQYWFEENPVRRYRYHDYIVKRICKALNTMSPRTDYVVIARILSHIRPQENGQDYRLKGLQELLDFAAGKRDYYVWKDRIDDEYTDSVSSIAETATLYKLV